MDIEEGRGDAPQQMDIEEDRGDAPHLVSMFAKSFNCVIMMLNGVLSCFYNIGQQMAMEEGRGGGHGGDAPQLVMEEGSGGGHGGDAPQLVMEEGRGGGHGGDAPQLVMEEGSGGDHGRDAPQLVMEEGRSGGHGGDAPHLVSMFAKSFNCVIPVLIGVLQVHIQGNGESSSPFQTHPTNMWVFVFSTFVYFSIVQRTIPLAVVSGSLSSVSLVSVLLPPWLGQFIFIPWAFVPTVVAYQLHAVAIHHACRRFHQIIKNTISKLSSICDFKWFGQRSISVGQQRPSV